MNAYRSIRDLSGYQFGRLTVIRKALDSELTPQQLKSADSCWLCHCQCGKDLLVFRYNLTTGHTRSCGCSRIGQRRPGNKGKSSGDKRIKNIWQSMNARCYLKSHKHYKHYGGKGIRICDEWLHSFEAFRIWMLKNGYTDDLTIDRIDNDLGYSPENCRLITMIEQQSNKLNSITCDSGKSLRAECLERGLNYSTIRMRYKSGYSINDALTTTPSNKFYYNGKTMTEWCEEIGTNPNKIKTRMCRHKESFKSALLHYARRAGNVKVIDFINNFIPEEKDSNVDYYRPRKINDQAI